MTTAQSQTTVQAPTTLQRAIALAKRRSSFALATIVNARGSSPLDIGTLMLVIPDATRPAGVEVVGTLSGGCIESAVIELSKQALGDGTPYRESFGISDDQVFSLGLSCGGVLDVLIVPVTADSEPAKALAEANPERPGSHPAFVVDGPRALLSRPVQTLTDDDLQQAGVTDLTVERLRREAAGRRELPRTTVTCGSQRVTVVTVGERARPTMIIVGAETFAQALTRLAHAAGYRVILVDPRPVFATRQRFPGADRIIVDWPTAVFDDVSAPIGPDTAICVLSHDARFETDVLAAALRSSAGYVGALGSRRTDARRRERLAAIGVDTTMLARLRSPIGLDLSAATPEETAVSILAEVVAARSGASARPLSELEGSIHHREVA